MRPPGYLKEELLSLVEAGGVWGGGGIQSPPALEAFTALARLAREGFGEVRVDLGRPSRGQGRPWKALKLSGKALYRPCCSPGPVMAFISLLGPNLLVPPHLSP